MKRILIIPITFALLIAPLGLYSQEQLDAETQKLWDAHTVVPKTDDTKELRTFLQYGSDNWMQMNGRIRESETWQRFDGVFAPFADHSFFEQATLKDGVVVWPGGLDIAPDAMYREIKESVV